MKKTVLVSAICIALIIGCGDDKQESGSTISKTLTESVASAKSVTANLADKAKNVTASVAEISNDVQNKVSNIATDVTAKTKEVTASVVEKAQNVTSDISNKVTEVKDNVVSKVSDVKQEVAQKSSQVASSVAAVVTPAPSGKDIYTKTCTSCHGANGNLKALNVSKIIKDLSKEELEHALMGYKDGSYGGAMKGVMQGQVATLNAKQLESLVEYIATLKNN